MDTESPVMEMEQYMGIPMLLFETDLSKHARVVGGNRQPAYYPRDRKRMAPLKDNMKFLLRYMYTLSILLIF